MYNLKVISTRAEWHRFSKIVETTDGASFTLHPDWLYGYELVPVVIKKIGYFIYNDKNEEIGGISGIQYWIGKWITIYPSDPFYLSDIKFEVKKQIWRVILEQNQTKTHVSSDLDLEDIGLKKGKFPKGIYPNPGIGAVDILKSAEEQIMSLKYQVRRNIKRSIEQEIEIVRVSKLSELSLFYSICKINAKESNYSIRPYLILKKMWKRGLQSESFSFYLAKKDNKSIGAIWTIKSGNMYHNIMGGSLKLKPRIEVGYAIQWGIIEASRRNNFTKYNISIGGPKGVEQFKDDFGRKKINLTKQYVGIFNK
jgi:lipid II:glycine glycyltransferase (peptidoglycan interpeptide bridge formation enzyme)